jgi:hypothetical protein
MVIGAMVMNGKQISFFGLIGLLLLSQAAYSGVYKWTDENGKVHFGDRPPVEQEKEQVVVPKGPVAKTEGAASAAENNASRQETTQRLLDQYAAERDEKKKASIRKQEEKARRKENCAVAQDNLRNYQEHGRIYKLLPNGERYYYSSEEREQALARARAEVKRWCD